MARLDWDRLRRTRPLDGADVRVDPDGTHLWERDDEGAGSAPGPRRLRHGVIVRSRSGVASAANTSADAASEASRARGQRCCRCGARISTRKLLRHARRCPRRPTAPSDRVA